MNSWRAKNVWVVLALLSLSLFCSSCINGDDAGKHQAAMGELSNACTLSDVAVSVFGPTVFSVPKGKPVAEVVEFSVPSKGEVCLVVINGVNGPPHGQRVSSAWISIDGDLVLGPDSFSQQVDEVRETHLVDAGPHELSVKLASKPDSFVTIELVFLQEDTVPPEITISPMNGEHIDTDMPLVTISYGDAISGVVPDSLSVVLNGMEVANRFDKTEVKATWKIEIDDYLEEGQNVISVSLSDQMGNIGTAESTFYVNTPTAVLVEDFGLEDVRYKKRSAYKLIFRREEIGDPLFQECLNQLGHTPESRATNRLLEILQDSASGHFSQSLSATAIGATAKADPPVGERPDLLIALGNALMKDNSFLVKAEAARALGLTKNSAALPYLEQYLTNGGPISPPVPIEEYYENHIKYETLSDAVAIQVVRAIIRIAGAGYHVGRSGDLETIRKNCVLSVVEYFSFESGTGGAP